jgi:PAS domain S-box-containing protein
LSFVALVKTQPYDKACILRFPYMYRDQCMNKIDCLSVFQITAIQAMVTPNLVIIFCCIALLLSVLIWAFFNSRLQCRKMEKKLVQSQQRNNILQENAGDAVVILSEQGKLLYASASVDKVIGYTQQELLKLDLSVLAHPDDIAGLQQVMMRVMESPGMPVKGHTGRMLHKDGTWHWYEAVVTNMLHEPMIGGIVDNFRDVTDRVIAEEKMINANRLYAFISAINQTIVHASTEQEVFREACRIAIEHGEFKMAWIGLADPDGKSISLVESTGVSDEDRRLLTGMAYDDKGPINHVLCTGTSFVCNDIETELKLPAWIAYATSKQVFSFMILPIKKESRVIGALSLSAFSKHLFNRQEIQLLEEAAQDISFALDVFEKEKRRQDAQKKLSHSELRLNEAQAIAHVGSWEVDFYTGMSIWSDETCRIFGLPVSENHQPYQAWMSFIHPGDLEFVAKTTEHAEATHSNSAFYHRIIRKDGAIRYIYTKTEFDFRDGIPIGLHGIAHDITEIRRSEDARAQSEANLRLIIDLIPQAIFVKNYEGKFQFVNKSFAALYGMMPQGLMEKSRLEEIAKDEEKNIFLKQDQEVINTGETKIIPEQTFTNPSGESKTFYTIKVPYTVAGKNEKGILGIALDITEQKLISAEREKLVADLLQRNSDLEQFSYIISHNLRAPVANILGITEVMRSGIDKDEEAILMKGLESSVSKLDEVIKDLNYILRMNNKGQRRKEWIKFSEIINDIKLSINQEITNEHAIITSDFSAADHMLTIKVYLYSIFYNLILNSVKYRSADVAPKISITSHMADDKIRIIFKDNGLGIDLEKKGDEVFGLYKRFHSHVEGKGVGLYMVKKQVEALNGQIIIESEVDKGTIFTITFQYKQEAVKQ